MLDDRESTPGDLVHDGNFAQWQQKFCEDTGHSMQCISETVADMSRLAGKVCVAFNIYQIEEIIAAMGVEEFDRHIRAILASKDCNCKN